MYRIHRQFAVLLQVKPVLKEVLFEIGEYADDDTNIKLALNSNTFQRYLSKGFIEHVAPVELPKKKIEGNVFDRPKVEVKPIEVETKVEPLKKVGRPKKEIVE
jgi:hypothetical protein